MLEFLRELVILSSETKDSAGVRAAQELVFRRLEKSSPRIEWLVPERAEFAEGLLAAWGPSSASGGICLLSHADTVYSRNELRSFSVEGEHVLGGGVADNKGGICIAIAAIEKLFDRGVLSRLKRPLYLFSSSCEELGSPAFQDFIRSFSMRLDYLLGMEPALPDGSLIKSRRGNRYYNIVIVGNSVHTGRDLRQAANPVAGLAQLHVLIDELRAEHLGVDASINGIRGTPFKYNMSSEKIEVTLDTRFARNEDIRGFHDDFVTKLSKLSFASPDGERKGRFHWELVDDCPAFDTGEGSPELKVLAEIYGKHEAQPVGMGAGLGASDCCYFYREGLRIVDGLGPRGAKIHSPEEYAEWSSFEKRSEALAEYLEWLNDL